MEQIGDNAFSPGMTSSMFIPDQLVSGPLQVVTDTVTIALAGPLIRGAVLGRVTATLDYVLSVKTATDGSEKPVAILVDNVDTTAAAQQGGVYLMGEFNQNKIIIDASWTLADLKIALRPLGIFLRDSVQAPIS